MIPASHWHLNGDGKLWVAASSHGSRYRPVAGWRSLDRPCDTCDGLGVGHPQESQTEGYWEPCLDCDGTGRHTFTVEVANQCAFHQAKLHENGHPDRGHCICGERPDTFRVSVVEGMVLPIYGGYKTRPVGHIWINGDGDAWHHDINESRIVILPSAAAPGMWCVKLAVHQ
jgi:hypothetical protein